ncbi:MAG: hypothetical protein V1733_05245 [bacterium]
MKTSLHLLFIFVCGLMASAQPHPALERLNEFYGGYGTGSIYYFTGNINYKFNNGVNETQESDPNSIGTFFLGYNRQLNRVISLGFLLSYMNFWHTSKDYSTNQSYKVIDNNYSGITRIIFCYLNKPIIRMYCGVGIGISVVLGHTTWKGEDYTDRKIRPAGQLTLFGVRVGKALAGFGEFGVGTNSIIQAGISYQFGK